MKVQSKSTFIVVPDGIYRATLMAIRPFRNAHGERIGFEFTLHGEGVQGQKVLGSTSPRLSPKSKLADVLRGLLGRELMDVEMTDGIDLEDLVGSSCSVVVFQVRGGSGQVYSNVEKVLACKRPPERERA